MIKLWQTLSQDNQVNLSIVVICAVFAVIAYFGKRWFESSSPSGQNIANTGSGTITLEQYDQGLKRREIEVREELKQVQAKNPQVLVMELQAIQAKLQNSSASYEEYISSLKQRITQLETLRGQIPDELLAQAISAIKQGNNKDADQLFKQVEEQADAVIKVAAEAAYQRCLIAEDAIRYLDALKHGQKAVRLMSGNSLYLNQAGLINDTLANYQKAIDYYELALASDLKMFGEDHPKVAIRRNNLGSSWGSLGQYEKAIDYYELALSSDLKTFGEDHPKVAIRRNNLGLAWKALGEYQKAIGYLELALASDQKTFGDDHPDVAIDRNNLGSAWYSLGEYQKAIGYLELALASDLKTFGEDHPAVARDHNNLGNVWYSLGKHEKAIGYLELALATYIRVGKDHPSTHIIAINLAAAKKQSKGN